MSSVKRKKKLNSMTDNDDLLTEILVRLPLKSLLRCKSVSKRWRSLISKYDFVPLSDKPTSPPFKTLTFVNHPSGLTILQSCHGLLFCSSFRDRDFRHDYYIYNPTTKQFLTLPRPGGQNSTFVQGITLAYDPDKSPHYKVVCVRKPKSFIANDNESFRRGVFWNGAIYWRGHSFYFNVNEEKLRKMPIPDVWKDGSRFGYFDASREHLHLAVISPCRTKFDVYEMKRDYSGWFLKYHVDLEAIAISFPDMITICVDPPDLHYYKFVILGIIREADDGESYMVLHIPGKAIRYNLHDKTFIKIFDFSPGREDVENICNPGYLRFNWYDDAYQYIETLACI
ncbi:hypothetical protein EZV62_005517 [Acer yangbiense]|uniref:F-box domain-containing protein n=1 Tax=Acer yangbiense TaxID=1000413 RepID=A0A5C7IQC1_9ROSI|nr:hypothetical protein EZV62_005517 [Acer yangbiense]